MIRILFSILSVAILQVMGTVMTYWSLDAGIPTDDLFNLSLRVLYMQQLYSTVLVGLYVLILYLVIQYRGEKLERIARMKVRHIHTKGQGEPKK